MLPTPIHESLKTTVPVKRKKAYHFAGRFFLLFLWQEKPTRSRKPSKDTPPTEKPRILAMEKPGPLLPNNGGITGIK